MDLPTLRRLLGDPHSPGIEQIEHLLDRLTMGASALRSERIAVFPGGIDSRGEIGVGHGFTG
jgi:hypothetical protein